MTNPNPYVSPPEQPVAADDLAALAAAEPSATDGHSPPVERTEAVPENELRRMVIDAVSGQPKVQRDPTRRDIQERILREVEEIQERGDAVELPFDLPESAP